MIILIIFHLMNSGFKTVFLSVLYLYFFTFFRRKFKNHFSWFFYSELSYNFQIVFIFDFFCTKSIWINNYRKKLRLVCSFFIDLRCLFYSLCSLLTAFFICLLWCKLSDLYCCVRHCWERSLICRSTFKSYNLHLCRRIFITLFISYNYWFLYFI